MPRKSSQPASRAWSCLDRSAGRDENGRSGFRVPQKCDIFRLNSGSSGECRLKVNLTKTGARRMWRLVGHTVWFVSLLAGIDTADTSASVLENPLHTFCGIQNCSDGGLPMGNLVRDGSGNLYGTAFIGGASQYLLGGTVFELAVDGTFKVLHSFCIDQSCTDGLSPEGKLERDANGNLYGSTQGGGGDNYGVVFKITLAGKEHVLHSFTGGKDGCNPLSGVTLGRDGYLYGTTVGWCGPYYGTVFKISPKGAETVLHVFRQWAGGALPYSDVILDDDGNVYGTTYSGGGNGYGTVFQISPTGQYTILHSFCRPPQCVDGMEPWGGLVRDAQGNLYGTTDGGGNVGATNTCAGDYYTCGTVFKLSPDGTYTILYRFAGGSDGANPRTDLILNPNGNLFGTTAAGGSHAGECGTYGCGVAFEIMGRSKERVLYSFKGGADGVHPFSGLSVDPTFEHLYGVTEGGGTTGYGVLFELSR